MKTITTGFRNMIIAAPMMAMLLGACWDHVREDAQSSMKITTYDDGRSCPGNCDAHFVLNPKDNGTINAFQPAPGQNPFANRRSQNRTSCTRGTECAVCFGPSDSSCMVAMYRGGGPAKGRVDVTPAFMSEWCPQRDIPAALGAKCKTHMATARTLATRVNCIATPNNPKCAAIMARKNADKTEDQPRYEQCRRVGEATYNASQSNPADHRKYDCAYFANRRLVGANGIELTPGACGDGYFVGRIGLDCCSADPVQAAIDIQECGIFYLE